MITKLRRLWQEAFGDSDSFLDGFFATAYSPERCQTLFSGDSLAAALYWFDGEVSGKKYAYIYAVATAKAFQNQGYCRKLMEKTHSRLKDLGYQGALLVPGESGLFKLYEKLGYQVCCTVSEFSCQGSGRISLEEITAGEYARQRQRYIPEGAFLPDDTAMGFLQTYGRFWKGENWLLAASVSDGCLHVQEYLGDAENAPAITGTLGASQGNFRTLGKDRPFAMYHPLTHAPAPRYFSLAMD